MIDKMLRFADEFDMLPKSGTVLVCVSGGADSMCLLVALLDISNKRGFAVSAAHYNHKLRGGESERDEAFVREQCAIRGVPFFLGAGNVKAYAEVNGLGIEESARVMRYDFFIKTAMEMRAERIATAHTADDNAETVIINLSRGAGAAGLSGIPPKRSMIRGADERDGSCLRDCFGLRFAETAKHDILLIRPMLRVSREEVMRYISSHCVPFVEDSSNKLDIYTRNKVRHAIIPAIRDINPRFNEAVAATATLSRADDEYLSKVADEFIKERCTGASANAAELFLLPFAVSGRVVRKLCGSNLSFNHVTAVLELCGRSDPSACLSLPGMTVHREYDRVLFGGMEGELREGTFDPIYPKDGACMAIPGAGLKMSCKSVVCNDIMIRKVNKSVTSFLFKCAGLCGRMSVRPRREGDTIKLLGRKGTKTLKRLYIERRVPAWKRALIPVVADDAGVLAVYGLGTCGRAVPKPGDVAIQIVFEET